MVLFVSTAWLIAGVPAGRAATLRVGAGSPYTTPCQAITAAVSGDVVEIEAATYVGDVCAWYEDNITIRGVNGRPVIDANGLSSQQKGTWVSYGDNTVIENIEFTGAQVPDRNGAGIRFHGNGLTIRNCYFHHNENGILTGDGGPDSQILIEHSEFGWNGYGDGQSHNMYIGNVSRFILQHCYSHHAEVGHLVKSRAAENYILYNRLTTEAGGQTSYEIDIPNGGLTYVIGNVIEQAADAPNGGIISYRREGAAPGNPDDSLLIVNNTFVNDRSAGNFVLVGFTTTPVVVRNNIFFGPGEVINQAEAVLDSNFVGDPYFVNAAGYDYRLAGNSPAINAGADPGMHGSYSLTPQYQYVHLAGKETRTANGVIDIGAFEYGASGGEPEPAPVLSGLLLGAPEVLGGEAVTGNQVTLDRAAPSGGSTVTLTSSTPEVAAVPGSVTVAAGSTSSDFAISTSAVAEPVSVTVTASLQGQSYSQTLVVRPAGASEASSADIGNPALAGGTTVSGDTITVQGAGANIWLSADQFHFYYWVMEGDGMITARVVSQTNTHLWAKAGVMIRETLEADSPFAMVCTIPYNFSWLGYRASSGATVKEAARGDATNPKWVRLVRSGDIFTAFVSDDGTSWSALGGEVSVPMGSSVYAGLAVTSHNSGAVSTAVFDHVTYEPAGGDDPEPADGPTNEVFGEQVYWDILDRPSDPAGLTAVINALNGNALSQVGTAINLIESPEYYHYGAFIIRCYLAIMRRGPDYGGWLHWYDAMRSGYDKEMIVAEFVKADEFVMLYGALTDAEFVALVYGNVLDREPDPAGFDHWMGLLEDGSLTRAGMMMQFIISEEYTEKTATAVQAQTLHLALLRRTADPVEAQNWKEFLDQYPLAAAIDYFLNGSEYKGRFQ